MEFSADLSAELLASLSADLLASLAADLSADESYVLMLLLWVRSDMSSLFWSAEKSTKFQLY